MKKLKKALVFIMAVVIYAGILSNSAAAVNIGSVMGSARYTDVRVYINGFRIPNFSINRNSSIVLLRDLRNYGFDVTYDERTRTSTLIRNPNKLFTPITNFDISTGPIGEVAFNHRYTDIKTVIEGRQITSYNIRGYLAIPLEELRGYGIFVWDGAARELKFTLNPDAASPTPLPPAQNYTPPLPQTGSFWLSQPGAVNVGQTVQINPSSLAVSWYSANPGIASVNSSGRVTGISSGTVMITAVNPNGVQATVWVTVNPAASSAVTSVSLDRTSVSVAVNDIFILNETVMPANAENRTVSWYSSNPNVAAVNSSGRVTGISAGTATIRAESINGITASCAVTVHTSVIRASSVELDRPAAAVTQGQSITLSETVRPLNATDRGVAWTSSNTGVATVSSGGRVTGVSTGTAVITAATVNGLTASCTVTVISSGSGSGPVDIWLSLTSATINEGASRTITANIIPENALNRTVTWSSSDTNVANTDRVNGATVAITGRRAGTAVITATASNGLTASCTVTVTVVSSGNYWTGEYSYRSFPTVPDCGTMGYPYFNSERTASVRTDTAGRVFYDYRYKWEDFGSIYSTAFAEMEAELHDLYQSYTRELTRQGFWVVGVPQTDINVYQKDNIRVTVTRPASGDLITVMIETV